jgi:predicted DNA-binding transcriptional regulator AlpA
MTHNKQIMTNKEVANFLGVSTRTLARWHAHRKGPARISAGRKPLYRFEAILHWLQQNEAQPLVKFSGEKYDRS